MFDIASNVYVEEQERGGSSVLKKRRNSFSSTGNSQNKRRVIDLQETSFSKDEKENLNKPRYIFQEINYGSDIYPLDPLPFLEIQFSLKSKNTPIKYSYDEIKYLKKMKNQKNSVLMKLFCDKFNKELNSMTFYRVKITCVYNPIVINNNGEWDHIINQGNNSKIKYDEKLIASFVKKKLKHEEAYKDYCEAYPNTVNFLAFAKKISKKRRK